MNKDQIINQKGATVTLALVFGGIFLILLGGVLGFLFNQLRQAERILAFEQALAVAEAGLHYFKWCLNNNLGGSCQLSKQVQDLQGRVLGSFTIEPTPELSCGQAMSWKVSSRGTINRFPDLQRTLKTKYAKASVAKYSFLLNDNVWAGSDRIIRGLYHSNGGIRMDGLNLSLVTSSKDQWLCTQSFGCTTCPTSQGCTFASGQCTCPGVFGSGQNSDLWQWPVPPFDFEGITVDLADIKSAAQSSDQYFPPVTNINPRGKGWHIVFQPDGTAQVRIITQLRRHRAYSIQEGWHWDEFSIQQEYLYTTLSLLPTCQVIFVEDNLWLEGQVRGKISVASANLINPNKDTDIILVNNITYTDNNSDGLGVIGERNVLISPDSPNNMELRGVYIAQKGRFGRNHYPNNFRDTLVITGSIVSNQRVGSKWGSGGQFLSGYANRENYFDQNLVYSPPPFVPSISQEYELVNWEEVR